MNAQQDAIIQTIPIPLPQHGADCRALTTFHDGRDTDLGPACNTPIHLHPWGVFSAATRAVMTLVMVTIVPSHEARGAP